MKFIVCKECGSYANPTGWDETPCGCGQSTIKSVDGLIVEVSGPCMVIGINNLDVVDAMRHSAPRCILAWSIAEPCSTVRRMKA